MRWSGALLRAAFENTTTLFTNGTGVYCNTRQKDGAVLGALFRRALASRGECGSPPKESAVEIVFNRQDARCGALVRNVYLAVVQVVQGIAD
ncbi:hypothetical protein DICSQDRAFT_168248 [Dichomitus squalens LYAD-421 SS1]|uniref:uncharacterized protein n=1 Tax=Dichomitus squalens (strain LYAD-421) TaxID=732165 RepID=UPI0004411BC5|nr:uncharacterized protein DICSQDRAFT_168248 [Dichomitus squalens LYAD-421 SS1]EJF63365.1 hypothetical protein DICSQDRAFT_168248 [Dichomitus squalens LYAD-421 SS1]